MIGVYLFGIVLRMLEIIYRNSSTSAATRIILSRKDNKEMVNAVLITVMVPRIWKVRPGQYVYLWFPQLGWRYAFQSHPFYVAQAAESGQRHAVELLVEKKKGFSARLHNLVRSTETLRTTPVYYGIVEGPYLDAQNTEMLRSSKLLLFGNGCRIIQQLEYLRYMLQNSQSDDLPQRKIVVVWSFEVGKYLMNFWS